MILHDFLGTIRYVKECIWNNNYVYNKETYPRLLCPNTSMLTVLRETTEGEFAVSLFYQEKEEYMIIITFSKLQILHIEPGYIVLSVDPRIIRSEEEYFQQSLIRDLSVITYEEFTLICDAHAMLFDIYESYMEE